MNARVSSFFLLLSLYLITVYSLTYTHDQTVAIVTKAGISINSIGNCSNQNQSNCTSLEGMHWECIDGPNGITTKKF